MGCGNVRNPHPHWAVMHLTGLVLSCGAQSWTGVSVLRSRPLGAVEFIFSRVLLTQPHSFLVISLIRASETVRINKETREHLEASCDGEGQRTKPCQGRAHQGALCGWMYAHSAHACLCVPMHAPVCVCVYPQGPMYVSLCAHVCPCVCAHRGPCVCVCPHVYASVLCIASVCILCVCVFPRMSVCLVLLVLHVCVCALRCARILMCVFCLRVLHVSECVHIMSLCVV